MNGCGEQAQAGGAEYVCACLKITHADLVRALAEGDVRTLQELRARTGAGDACTACHRRLCSYLARQPAEMVG